MEKKLSETVVVDEGLNKGEWGKQGEDLPIMAHVKGKVQMGLGT